MVFTSLTLLAYLLNSHARLGPPDRQPERHQLGLPVLLANLPHKLYVGVQQQTNARLDLPRQALLPAQLDAEHIDADAACQRQSNNMPHGC